MEENEMIRRTKMFASSCIDLCDYLPGSFLGNYLKSQLTRSACSTAANYRATRLSQSKPAFISKLSITIEETDESVFWLETIKDKNLLNRKESESLSSRLLKEGQELTSIFVSTRKTMRSKYLNKP